MTWREFFERYGVTAAVFSVLTLVVLLLPGNAETVSQIGSGQGQGAFGAGPGGAQAFDDGTQGFDELTGGGPGAGTGQVTGPGGGSAGGAASGDTGEVAFGTGPDCRSDKRQKGISGYMPPCVQWTGTTNPGATARGVAKESIKVVRWLGQVDPATQAILEGAKLADSRAVRKRAYEAFVKYGNQHHQTYGREVVMVDYNASGPSDDDKAMRADAIEIAETLKAFAVITGTPDAPIPATLATELAARKVVCMCTVSGRSEWYAKHPPYMFSSLPTITEYSKHVSEYIGKRLAGKNAEWAGDELNPTQAFTTKQRKFGLIYLAGAAGRVEPEAVKAKDELVAELGRYGVKVTTWQYFYDPGRNQNEVSTMIGKMRESGITTVILYVDPLYPILITDEAARQRYYPEWFIAGTGLSDTTAAARLYNQTEWRHAFGISPLWVTWRSVENSPGYREFYHARPDIQPGSCGPNPCEGVLLNIYRAYIQTLFRGIHMAGPVLTADSFAAGQYAYPPTGGTPARPLVFLTRSQPTEIKDFTEIYYDISERGPDERGEQGQGMIMKVDGGRRYRVGEWPSSNPKVFNDPSAVAVSDNPAGGADPPHEQDGHTHDKRCLSCPD